MTVDVPAPTTTAATATGADPQAVVQLAYEHLCEQCIASAQLVEPTLSGARLDALVLAVIDVLPDVSIKLAVADRFPTDVADAELYPALHAWATRTDTGRAAHR